jgi:hypothetical protein
VATTNKDFRIKNGLVVEGATSTVNGNQVLTTASSLDSLSDVVITTPVTSQVLSYNGTSWVNSSSGGGGTTTNALTIGTGLSGTSFNGSTAVTIAIDSTVVTTSETQTLTNKSLTSPIVSSISNTGTVTFPTSTDTLVGRATTDTLTNKTLTAPVVNLAINSQTGTTYIPVISDNGKLVTLDNASAITLTVPTNIDVSYATGAQIHLLQLGDGQVSVAGDTGVTVYATPGANFRAKYSGATLIKLDTDIWLLGGDLS